MRLRDLKGFGPKSEEILANVDIHSVDEFMQTDPYELYALLKEKMEILLRLDDMGIAPK